MRHGNAEGSMWHVECVHPIFNSGLQDKIVHWDIDLSDFLEMGCKCLQ